MKTLYDLQAYLLDTSDVHGDAVNRRRALRSAIAAVTDVMQRHPWKQYEIETIIALGAPVTLSASIDSSGTVTVSSGTIPSWATSGSLLVSGSLYRVLTNADAATLTIEGWASGVFADAEVKIVNDRYVITADVRGVEKIGISLECYELDKISTTLMTVYQVDEATTQSRPRRYSVSKLATTVGESEQSEIRFSPAPNVAVSFELKYHRMPRIPFLSHQCDGVTIEDDTTVATFNRPLPARADVANSVLLLSADEERPEGELGSDYDGELTEASEILTVSSRASSTSVNLAAAHAAVAGMGGVLTDVLDIPDYTWNVATLFADANFMRHGRGETGAYWQTIRQAESAMDIARAQEAAIAIHPGPPLSALVEHDLHGGAYWHG